MEPLAQVSIEQRSSIIAEARRWIGTPYMHQASLKGAGCDCLGLARGVWRMLHGAEPEVAGPYTADWAEGGGQERLANAGFRNFVALPRGEFQAGDILLFRWKSTLPAKHLAIATSPGWMVHAHDGACVCEVAISSWWRRRLAYTFAFPASPRW